MENSLLIVAPFLIALAAAALIHPCIVKIAKMKEIVDNPNARKLHKEPVPILGGVVVYFGIFFSVACTHGFADCSSLLVAFAAMMIMLYTGTMDDILDLRPSTRFVVQILAVCLLIFVGHYGLDDLRGLWDIHALPPSEYIPLTIFACVGIVNALNLIDGVDGLSSGYCIMASLIFGAVFTLNGTTRPMSILALATAGSLLPFFLHNVFGRRSKMFIGDGGTLLMGITMSVFVMRVIQSEGVSHLLDGRGYSSVAFTLAVLSIPVFDTLRVMSSRMLKGRSPFHPDKTHLHHLFIELGCSHIITTIIILTLNFLIVLAWMLAGHLGASAEAQLYLVVGLALLFTTGIYGGFKLLQHRSPATFDRIVALNLRLRPQRNGFFLTLQRWIDKI